MLEAYVNHGHWIAECPRCKWAIYVQRGFGIFVCGVLPDGAVTVTGCGYSALVQFPINADDIEAVLRQRPGPNQNWHPYETLADLRIENAAHQLASGIGGA